MQTDQTRLAIAKRAARHTILTFAGSVLLAACGSTASDDTAAMNVGASGASAQQGTAGSAGSDSSAGGSPSGAGGGSGGAVEVAGAVGIAGAAGSSDASGSGGVSGSGGASGSGAATSGGGAGTPPTNAGAGGAEQQPYNPCPPQGKPCVILPVGDSITAGSQSSDGGGYREPLFELASMNKKSLTFVGANKSGPATVKIDNVAVAFPQANSGYSGYEIDSVNGRQGISQFFPAQIASYKPNIVLLMIGTNDVDTGVPNIPPRLGALLDTMLAADPALLVVVAQIVPQQKATTTPDTKNMQVQAYNAAIPPLVKARAAAGKHLLMVDMYSALTANPNYSTVDFANQLHPNDTGYKVMANTWYAAIGPLLH